MYGNLIFKKGVNPLDLSKVHPALLVVIGEFALYCEHYGLPCVVSSLTDSANGRRSDTHPEGRAVDFSVRGFSEFHIRRIEFHLNSKYAEELGTAPKGKPPRVVIVHDTGSGLHFHIQVNRLAMFTALK